MQLRRLPSEASGSHHYNMISLCFLVFGQFFFVTLSMTCDTTAEVSRRDQNTGITFSEFGFE